MNEILYYDTTGSFIHWRSSTSQLPLVSKKSVLGEAVSLVANVENNDEEQAMVQETAELLASLSDVILSPIKVPKTNGNNNQEFDAAQTQLEVS